MRKYSSERRSIVTWYFALLERRPASDRLLLQIAVAFVMASVIYSVAYYSNAYATQTASQGGTFVEGIIGTPRFVNPVLATTRADSDMADLIYSGLVKIGNANELVNDLAESIELSDDGQTYTITIRPDAYFNDGSPVTAKDVAFTIALIQNPNLKSPLRGNWEGVIVQELGEKQLEIVTSEPYTPFIENLTVGIIPQAQWHDLPIEQLPFSQNNTNPIGSGPYQIENIIYGKNGLIEAYDLVAAHNYHQRPLIDRVIIKFYTSENDILSALEAGDIMATASLSEQSLPRITSAEYAVYERTLPRTFAIFFNQNRSAALRDQLVREALSVAIDREMLIDEVLNGRAVATYAPVPAGFITSTSTHNHATTTSLLQAEALLRAAGWNKDDNDIWFTTENDEKIPLRITIVTTNTELFDKTAHYVATTWQSLGAEVSVEEYEQSDLVQSIIRPRSFEALLFGADIGRPSDLYPFWHSSQKSDPGLNISQFTDIDVDAVLERARKATGTTARKEETALASRLITDQLPAVFLFTPTFTYITEPEVTLDVFSSLSSPSERFSDIARWYVSSERLWPVFNTKR